MNESLSNLNITQILPALTLIFLRALGMTLTFPIGDGIVRSLAKVGFAGVLALLFLPTSTLSHATPISMNTASVLSELVFGLLLGLPLSLMVSLASSFGEIFDLGRGQSIAQIYDPNQQQQVSNMGQFWHQAALMTCFLFGAPEVLLKSFASSLHNQPRLELAQVISSDSAKVLMITISKCWEQMILIALPLLSVFVLVELCCAAISKLVPQLSLSSENFQLKSALAFVLCALAGVDRILAYWWQHVPLLALGG